MHYAKVMGAGVVAGLVGAAIWAFIAKTFHVEIAWIALGIGALVGVACHMAAQDRSGDDIGICAVAISLAAILAGKYMTIEWALSDLTDSTEIGDEATAYLALANDEVFWREQAGEELEYPEPESIPSHLDPMSNRFDEGRFEDYLREEAKKDRENPARVLDRYPEAVKQAVLEEWQILTQEQRDGVIATIDGPDGAVVVKLCDEIVEQRVQAGDTLEWPDGFDIENAQAKEEYPEGLWDEAVAKWNAMSSDEQQRMKLELAQEWADTMDEISEELKSDAFLQTFGLLDILFFGLAALVAWHIGSGRAGQD